MIKKVISGGQTGADMGALFAAHTSPGIETGGWAPRGFRTEAGPKKILGAKYKLKQTKSPTYPPRTELNVKNSDGTLWIGNTDSPGAKLTLKLCEEYDRPVKKVRFSTLFHRRARYVVPNLVKWVKLHNIEVLNVAGNRESTNSMITMYTEGLVTRLLRALAK